MKDSLDTGSERNEAAIEEAESFLPHYDTPKAQPRFQRRGVIAFFAALNIGALLLIYLLLRSKASSPAFPNPFPSIEYEIRSFNEQYERDTSVEEKWDLQRDYPPFDGYTFIDNAGTYGLPPGVLLNGKANRYGTAWTHQYHCLEFIHTAYEATAHNITRDEAGSPMDIHHHRHCFDYLRQHIICAMDMRLEYPTTNPKGINGYDIPRRCVKREALDKYMGEHGQQGK